MSQHPSSRTALSAESGWGPEASQNLGRAGRHSTFVSLAFKSGVLTIQPHGPRLGEREAPIVASEAAEALRSLGSRIKVVVLDLSRVQLMSSFGLGMCIDLRNSVKAMRRRTVVFGLTEELTMLFRLMKVDRLYTMVSSSAELQAAIAA